MLLIGLTGGIGMGKSTVGDQLVRKGEKLIDTDQLARKMVEPGQHALEEIRAEFGPETVNAEGMLDRSALARIVFTSTEARKRLEAILHPPIRAAWREMVERWGKAGEPRAIVMIPLLFETAAEKEFGRVICVACSREVQNRRLAARGWTSAEIEQRVAAQWPIIRKMDQADGVIWNESSLEVCEAQTARLITIE